VTPVAAVAPVSHKSHDEIIFREKETYGIVVVVVVAVLGPQRPRSGR